MKPAYLTNSVYFLSPIILFASIVSKADSAFAQASNIVPDNTLGNENSEVIENFNGLPVEVITGGAQREQNLFHSFQEFNVSEGRGAYFNVPNAEIQNILSRVTGNNPSEIMGVLGTFGESNPNLFLINPNGIIFGEGARLDVQGSFAATTANGIEFGEQGNFAATNPQIPQLLTINPSAFLFNQIQEDATIENSSTALAGQHPAGFELSGLRVPDGNSLLLIGGDINLNGGNLNAVNGRIELGGLKDTGTVALEIDNDNNFGTTFTEDNISKGNVTINNARVYVFGSDLGEIKIAARNLEITNSSQVYAGIWTGLGTESSQTGNIILDITDNTNISNSLIFNTILGTGDSGDTVISTTNLSLTDGAILGVLNDGRGDLGNLVINAANRVSIDASSVQNNIQDDGRGIGGNLEINANSLILNNGAQLQASTNGIGDAGNIILNISEETTLDNGSGVFSNVGETGQGNSGRVEFVTNTFSINNLSGINVNIFGVGNSGNITIDAKTVSLDSSSQVFNNVERTGEGNAGNINLTANSINLTNGSQISSSTRGNGNGGTINITADNVTFDGTGIGLGNNGELGTLFSTVFSSVEAGANGNGGTINITANSLTVSNEAQLAAGTTGNGNAGNIFINADTVLFDGGSLFSNVEAVNAEGNGGIVEFNANNISILNGSQLVGSTFGIGNAGSFTINAEDRVVLDGLRVVEEQEFPSTIFSSVQRNAIGNGSRIEINTNNLAITNGARLDATTRGNGDAGNIIVNAKNISLDGTVNIRDEIFRSGIFSEVRLSGIGNGGAIDIDTDNFSITNGAIVTTRSFGEGRSGNIALNSNFVSLENDSLISSLSISQENAGNITLSISGTLEANNSEIDASSFRSAGGQINITAEDILLTGNSDIETNVFTGAEGGGDITLTANSIIAFDDSDILAFARDGQGGNITLDTPAYFGENFTLNSLTSDPDNLEGNSRADINATGAVSGFVTIPDVSFIQNSLTELPDNAIDTDSLVANSCVVRSRQNNGRFVITGGDGLPVRPGNAEISEYPTGEVRNVTDDNSSWQPGEPIIEPQGMYRLNNGKLVLSRECDRQ